MILRAVCCPGCKDSAETCRVSGWLKESHDTWTTPLSFNQTKLNEHEELTLTCWASGTSVVFYKPLEMKQYVSVTHDILFKKLTAWLRKLKSHREKGPKKHGCPSHFPYEDHTHWQEETNNIGGFQGSKTHNPPWKCRSVLQATCKQCCPRKTALPAGRYN